MIGMYPFGDPDRPYIFNIDFGLRIPCRFNDKKSCMYYDARPISCRLFPYWIYTEAPAHKMHEVFEEEMPTQEHHVQEFDVDDRPVYSMYVFSLHKIMYEEDHRTDKILQELGMKEVIDLREDYEAFYKEVESDKEISDHEKDKQKILHLTRILQRRDYSKEFRIIQEKMNSMRFHPVSELLSIEKVLKRR